MLVQCCSLPTLARPSQKPAGTFRETTDDWPQDPGRDAGEGSAKQRPSCRKLPSGAQGIHNALHTTPHTHTTHTHHTLHIPTIPPTHITLYYATSHTTHTHHLHTHATHTHTTHIHPPTLHIHITSHTYATHTSYCTPSPQHVHTPHTPHPAGLCSELLREQKRLRNSLNQHFPGFAAPVPCSANSVNPRLAIAGVTVCHGHSDKAP